MTGSKRTGHYNGDRASRGNVRVKICGITSPEDGLAAEAAGADAIGLMFVPESVRYLSMEQAREISDAVGPLVAIVAVFRDAPLADVLRAAAELPLGAVQLHGALEPAYLDEVKKVSRVVRAVSFEPGLRRADLEAGDESAVLLDGVRPGSGTRFDWGAAAHLRGMRRLMLAGGLNPGNVARGIGMLQPYAVDVSSGVESAPGVKDPGLIRQFVREARAASGEAVS